MKIETTKASLHFLALACALGVATLPGRAAEDDKAAIASTAEAFVTAFDNGDAKALAAFWTTRINAINQTYNVTFIFLSGFFAPLTVMPQSVQILANLLPFRWLLAFPIELLLGRLTLQETLVGFAMQLLWLLITLTLLSFVWRAGVKQYSAVGS